MFSEKQRLFHTSPAAAYKQHDLVFEVLNGAAGHAAKYIHMHLQIIHIGKSLENVLDSFENVTDIYFSFQKRIMISPLQERRKKTVLTE